MDIQLFNEIGKEFKRLFAACPINKILTIEASGIGIACIVAQYFDVPVVFAKKAQSINICLLYTSLWQSTMTNNLSWMQSSIIMITRT